MDEEKLEQPEILDLTENFQKTDEKTEKNCEKTETIDKSDENLKNQTIQDDGSNNKDLEFGKFKDARSLLLAYQNLEAKFTQKCQELNKILSASQSGKGAKDDQNLSGEDGEIRKKFDEFLEQHQGVADFADEILSKAKNLYLQDQDKSFEKAYLQVMLEKSAKSLNKNPSKIREEIAVEYLTEAKNNLPPKIVSGGVGYAVGKSQASISSLEDAKDYVKKLFSI